MVDDPDFIDDDEDVSDESDALDDGPEADSDDVEDSSEEDDVGSSDDPSEPRRGSGSDVPTPRPGRGQNRFQKLSNENRELRDRLDSLERRGRSDNQPSQYDLQRQRQEEQERLSLMSPDERADYRVQQMERRTEERLRRIELQGVESANRSAFQAKATVDPVYKKYADAVEDRVKRLKAENPGQAFFDREIVLKVIIGERVLSKGGQAAARGKRRGEGSVGRNSASSSSGRGDVQGSRSQSGKTAADRLRGKVI